MERSNDLTYRRISKVDLSWPSDIAISDEAKNLVSRLLVRDPQARLSLDEVAAHPFVARWYRAATPSPSPSAVESTQARTPADE
jgi:serine/threonine protein kinase